MSGRKERPRALARSILTTPNMPDTEPPPTCPEPPKRTISILRFFATHPVVGLIGTVASVLGVVLAVVFYLAAIRTRELSLYVNPSKTTIVKSGQSSDLHILYKGNDVSADVTALQVELWNAGKESIRSEHVLSPIILETSPKVPILEARIRHISRPVTQIALDTTNIADGKVVVSWKILEHSDGAVIQFIVAGPTETSIKPSATLEGQPRINVFHNLAIKERWIVPFGILCFLLLIALQLVYVIWLESRKGVYRYSVIRVFGPLLVVTVFLEGLFLIVLGTPSMPLPFD
jgi:hypothetical protein